MDNAEIYKLAEYILIWRGVIEALDAIRNVCIFTAGNMTIDGFFPLDMSQSTLEHPFGSISSVSIKHQPGQVIQFHLDCPPIRKTF